MLLYPDALAHLHTTPTQRASINIVVQGYSSEPRKPLLKGGQSQEFRGSKNFMEAPLLVTPPHWDRFSVGAPKVRRNKMRA